MQQIVEKITVLPNPHILRKPIVDKCVGCNKIFENYAAPEAMQVVDVCAAYADPEAIQRRGCALQSNKETEATGEKKKVNPLKWSKRRNRR